MEVAKARLNRMAASVKLLSRQSNEMLVALYDSGDALRIVPALNPVGTGKETRYGR